MASESEETPPAEDTVAIDADEAVTQADEAVTQADEAWPVADIYLIEPDERAPSDSPQPPADETVVLTQTQSPAPARRRFPPDVGTGLMLAIAGTVGALILVALLVGLRDDDPSATARTPTTTSSAPGETTTPAPTSDAIALRDLEGMPLAKAQAALEKEGLRVRVSRLESDQPRGEILNQAPPAGTKVAKGDVIALVVSSGAATQSAPESAQVPGVVGLAVSDAVATIRDAGFEARVQLVTSSQPAGTVLEQSPVEGTEASTGSTIVVEVAKEKSRPAVQRVEVPDVVGTTAADARRTIRSAGFTVTVVSVRSQEPAGTVISQSPRAGAELRKGSAVTLKVSTGPANFDVPDVTGMDEASARLELESAGFEVQVIHESTTDPAQDGVVVRQEPLGGSTAAEGAVITLTVARLS